MGAGSRGREGGGGGVKFEALRAHTLIKILL